MEIFLSSTVTAPIPSRAARWFALFKEAILGSKQDFTAISIDRAIVLLAVPMVLEMAMESLFGIVDIFFVAHLGADSTATVGITEGILVLVMAVAFGLSMGTTAVVARRVGEHDQNGAAEAAVQSILIGFGFAILIFAIAFPFAPELLRWMGAGSGDFARRLSLHANHVEQFRHHPAAFSHQCGLSRRRRCSHCHACSLAGEPHQFVPRSLPYSWAWDRFPGSALQGLRFPPASDEVLESCSSSTCSARAART